MAVINAFMEDRNVRTHLATLLAVGLCCGSTGIDALCTSAHAQDYSRLHLPGPLGRYFGIGYSAGYHTCEPPCSGSGCAGPGCTGLGQEVHSFAAPAYRPGQMYGPVSAAAACPQCSQPAPQPSFAPESVPPAAVAPLQHAPIQQPRREPGSTGPASSAPASSSPASSDPASPSDRAGFLKRLPHPSVQGPKKAAVARSSILEPEAR
ncbi:MAG: hypothetical protein ACTHK7_07395 [Aureliella sp.]